MVTVKQVQNDFADWSSWRANIEQGGITNLGYPTGVNMEPIGNVVAVARVPSRYLDKSTDRRIWRVETCFSGWPEAHQVAVTAKYLLPAKFTYKGIEFSFQSETDRAKWAAKELRCSKDFIYRLIGEAQMMVWQTYQEYQ
ncbi:MAG: hypothetical protein AB2809_01145 [Candidatus Thiodiazotropha sp.]